MFSGVPKKTNGMKWKSNDKKYSRILDQSYPFKRQTHKIVKHTQPTGPQGPTNCLSVFDHFVGLTLKGLYSIILYKKV